MSQPRFLDSIRRSFGSGSRERSIPTIDTLKGVSMIMMFHIHFAWAWRAGDWYSLLRFEWYITDFFGVATFLTMSLVGSMAGIQARWEGGDKTMYTRRKTLRMSFLILCGEVMNIMFAPALGPFHVAVWNVLTGIAVFSLLLPVVMKIPSKARLLLVVVLVLLYYPILEWSMESMNFSGVTPDAIQLVNMRDPRTIIYFLFFNHAMMIPLYPWSIVLVLTSVVFKLITSPRAFQSKDIFKRGLGQIVIVGSCLIAIGIVTGSSLVKEYDTKVFNELLVPGPYFTWPFPIGMFSFLIRHVPQSVFYGTGIAYIWFACLGWLQVVKGKHLPLQEKVNNVGTFSLTAYLLTHAAMLVPVQLPIVIFYIIFAPLLVLFVWGLWMWNKKYQGIGTLEFAMEAHAQAISMVIEEHRNRHGE